MNHRTPQVLNAFRHQRMNHLDGPGHADDVEGVLNAFRHQRMNHAIHINFPLSVYQCSTPFGINE